MGQRPATWTLEAIKDLLGGDWVVARNARAENVPVPFAVGVDRDAQDVHWTESADQIFVADRPLMVRSWWDAIARPGEVERTVVRRSDGDRWVREQITTVNLLDEPGIGVVLIGIKVVGTCEEPVAPAVVPELAAPEGTRVGRPMWLLQELTPLGEIIRTDGDVEHIFGRQPDELVGRYVLDLIHPDDHAPSLEMWTAVLARPDEMRTIRERVMRPDGSLCWIEASVLNRLDADQGGSILSICHDITERRAIERALRDRASTDALTGVLNRAATVEAIGQLLASGPATVGFVDLDGFKLVNDQFGHDAGDAVLSALAERLLRSVPPGGHVGRWGGDEFVLVARGDDATGILQAVETAIADPVRIDRIIWQPRASVGVVTGRPGTGVDDLVRDADRAMYRMKISRSGSGPAPSVTDDA